MHQVYLLILLRFQRLPGCQITAWHDEISEKYASLVS